MYEKKLVTVVMCVYNTPQEYLNNAVLSILNQTHKNFEFIIVDDCSSSDLYQDSLFNDDRITILRNSKNEGPAFSRNRALAVAKGEYIAIMDSDDYSYPTRLEEQIAFMEKNKDVVVCGTWYRHFGAKNNDVTLELDDNDYYRCSLLFGNSPTLLNPSAMIRTKTITENHIQYDDDLRLGEDYLFWVDISQFGKVTNLKKILVNYRIHDKQITDNNIIRRQSLKYDSIVRLKQIERLGLILTDKEIKMISSDYTDKRIKLKSYHELLTKIVDANGKSLYFDQSKLLIKTKEQWKSKILNVNNPFSLLFGIIFINGERKTIISTKWNQFKCKIKK